MKSDFWTTRQRYVASALTFLALVWGSITIITDPPEPATNALIAWLVALGIYVFSGWMVVSSSPGYIYFAVLVVLCVHGAGAAVLLALTGLLLITLIRRFSPMQALMHFALTGGVIVAASFICEVTGCDVVAISESTLSFADLLPLVASLVTAFVAAQLIYAALFDPRGRHIALVWQTIPFLLVPPVVLIYYNAGLFAYTAVIGLVAVQILRYHQLASAKTMLTNRVRELSVLNRVGEGITSSLVMDDLLTTIQERVHEFLPADHFYIALYDSETESVDYRLLDGDNTSETQLLTQTVIEKQQPYRLAPEGDTGADYFGLPLLISKKLVGVMGVKKASRFTDEEIDFLKSVVSPVSLGIRNTSLYNRSVEMTHHLTTINESLQQVMFNPEREEVLDLACDTAMQITGVTKAAVFLKSLDTEVVSLAYSIGLTEAHRTRYADSGFLPLIDGQLLIVQDVDTLDSQHPLHTLARDGGFRAIAQVPLKSTAVPVGALVLFYDNAHSVDPAQVQLLESLAYQLVSTLDNTDLLKALEDYAAEQTQLLHLSRVLNATLDLQTMIEKFTEILRRMLNIDEVWIGFMLHEDRGYIQFFNGEAGMTRSLMLTGIPELQPFVSHLHPVPRIYYRHDAGNSTALIDQMTAYGAETFAFMPLVSNSKVQGGVMLIHPKERHFSDNEWKLLDLATNQVIVQLNNAQLYDRAQTALDRRLQQLASLQDISQEISSARDSAQMIDSVLQAAFVAMQADFVAVGLLQGGDFRIKARASENNLGTPYALSQPPYTGVMGQVMRSGEVLVIPDNAANPDYIALGETPPRQSTLIVPLMMDNQAIGVLNIESHTPDYFTEEHISFARSLAGHVVVSIQNTRLLHERQSRIDTLTNLRDLSLRLAGTHSRESVLLGILRTAMDITGGEYAILYHTPDAKIMTVNGMHTEEDHLSDNLPYIPEPIIREVIKTGQTRFIEQVQDEEETDAETMEYGNMLAAPIKRGNHIREVLCVTFTTGNHRQNTHTIDLLTIQAASHLDNYDLLDRINTERDRNNAIVEATRDGIIMLDRSGYLVQANHSAENLLNIDLESITGKHFASSLLNLDAETTTNDSLRRALKEMGRVLRLDPNRITKRQLEIPHDNAIRYIDEVGSPVFDANGKIMGRLLTLRDVTDEKALEAYRDEITHTIVHDLRRPLTSIITGADTINMVMEDAEMDGTLELIKEISDISATSANSLLNLVDTILDLAKLEKADTLILNPAPVNVRSLVETAELHLMNFMQEAGITLAIDIPDDVPSVMVDNEMILRVIRNLLDNATRYAPQNGNVLIYAERYNTRQIIVKVADDGKGIPPGESEHIFDKFRQAKDNIPERGGKSTGIGLTFCRQAVEAHEGKIWVEQDGPLPGACFAFTLPIHIVPVAEQPQITPQ